MPETTCRRCLTPFSYALPEQVPAFARRFKPRLCCVCAAAERDAEEIAAGAAELAARNIPRRYEAAVFADFAPQTESQQQALVAARDHALEGVFLTGKPGCGKTHLAAAAIKATAPGSLFCGSSALLEDIRASFESGGRGLLERAKSAPLLALDDLGSEAVTDWVRDRLYSLLNTRWDACLPLIVTTNRSPHEIAERIGESAASRITGACAHRIEVIGPDRRRGPSKTLSTAGAP